ncbi:MAG TPA: lipid-binding protein [Algoriphagus sp.]|jgi:polyisoprenoid-binding protein YceI|uniref:YceI family protein n=1 Tax=unclassified Algoriphagus TaxID=2641541 RepID=UPI000C43A85E|nr:MULTISPECIES: YceI family protein [unclassified Algoriphagus]MAL14196.1 lipid-binding protein [Algoriphagus sp.]QYH37468.1 YceI family protein [Algoriphagus sp. NBT04N3]HAH37057.1 lipid-binding protein [Algoriphagus sp.]HAS56998.1 lipid-binding protein [Algoriphagus sp.]HCB46303.1 lipid-binding protein [Algoriphagus sp.]|tara:strand:+ start:10301 stop:10885 length:585 start_codon:yes stop_codon:yes gene_type:complete
MKSIIAIILSLAVFFTTEKNTAPATVNKSESSVMWKAAKVTGEHWGYVPIADATLDYSNGKITGGSFEMDMVNLTVEDLTDPKSKGNLTNHLKSDDFFSVEKFNTASFKITDAKSSNGRDYVISGNLTIKGISQPISFPAKVSTSGNKLTAEGDITFDRTKFDIKFRSGNYFENLADKLIYDDVNLKVKLVASI